MKRQMMTAVAVCALAFTAGCAATTTSGEARPLQAEGGAQTFTPAPVTATGLRADYPTTVAGATQFVADAEAKMLTFGEYAARV